MLLRCDDFAAFSANWNDKASNLEQIAEDFNLGLERASFSSTTILSKGLGSNCSCRKSSSPSGANPWDMLAALKDGRYFESLVLTPEDRNRHQIYQVDASRRELQRSCRSIEEFLLGLEMVAEHGPVSEQTVTRVTQLINKTNQFNLTSRRYTEDQVRAMAFSDRWWCHWFALADHFGDHGLIGVILAEKCPANWRIDTWLMSCPRWAEMEDFMGDCLIAAAKREGAESIAGEHVPTEKNSRLSQTSCPSRGSYPLPRRPSMFNLRLRDHLRTPTPYIREGRSGNAVINGTSTKKRPAPLCIAGNNHAFA